MKQQYPDAVSRNISAVIPVSDPWNSSGTTRAITIGDKLTYSGTSFSRY